MAESHNETSCTKWDASARQCLDNVPDAYRLRLHDALGASEEASESASEPEESISESHTTDMANGADVLGYGKVWRQCSQVRYGPVETGWRAGPFPASSAKYGVATGRNDDEGMPLSSRYALTQDERNSAMSYVMDVAMVPSGNDMEPRD